MSKQLLANVSIKTEGTRAMIYINGNKVPGVIGYSINHDAQETAVPILTLQVQCTLDVETQMVPLLPKPWSWFYKPKVENFVDMRETREEK